MSAKAKKRKQAQGFSRANQKVEPDKQSGFFERLIGAVMLKRGTYREIAHDVKGTPQAAIVVVAVALIVGIIAVIANVDPSFSHTVGGLTGQADKRGPLGKAIVLVIQELLIWGAAAWLIAAVARGYFKGDTNTGEMLRVFGFSRIFQILLVLGFFDATLAQIVSIAGLVLSITATVIGIKAATDFSTGKSALIGIFSIVFVAVLVSFFATMVLNPKIQLGFAS